MQIGKQTNPIEFNPMGINKQISNERTKNTQVFFFQCLFIDLKRSCGNKCEYNNNNNNNNNNNHHLI